MTYIIPSDVMNLVETASRCDETALLVGPTGCGKTQLAKLIHQKSIRNKETFVVVNLASLHEGTIESELFGHQRGAFTGAMQPRAGMFEVANRGTVFLDEIGELSLKLQARLLEFLNSKTISRIGCNEVKRLDVRVIAATHRNLKKDVSEGKFREDLFHRLRILEIPLKPLSEREEDFGELVSEILSQTANEFGKLITGLESSVARILEMYSWPGNIRELKNVLRFSVLVCDESKIQLKHLPKWLVVQKSEGDWGFQDSHQSLGRVEMDLSYDYYETLSKFEKLYIQRAFQRFRGRVNRTARQIGLSKTTLLRRLRAYGIDSSTV